MILISEMPPINKKTNTFYIDKWYCRIHTRFTRTYIIASRKR